MKYIIRYLRAFFVIGTALSMPQVLYTGFEAIDDADEFHDIVIKNNYLVVHFNPYHEGSAEDSALEPSKKAFFAVAHKDRYMRAGIMFVSANVPDITAHEPDLAQEFDEIGVDKETSTLMLLKNGKPVVKDDTAAKKISNNLMADEIEQVIEGAWVKQIDRILKRLSYRQSARVQRPLQTPSQTQSQNSSEKARCTASTDLNNYSYSPYPYDDWGYYAGYAVDPRLGYGWRGSYRGSYGRLGRGWQSARGCADQKANCR